ncbi:hypothetical protein [Stutzerimonas kunmingensis]|uniref:hypothetical protein n=1 Tax=Stutzerimonas kunmingensis TaxID=1211807 RepID=UPI00241DD5B0|nr:hypothetical protein [Stutzerimonas kunmingensis]
MPVLKELELDGINFSVESSQQFATVVFDRAEDDDECSITILSDGKINQFTGDNRYNPSVRRFSTCVYVREEWDDGDVVKICTIQHKGVTLVEVHSVAADEINYLFNRR